VSVDGAAVPSATKSRTGAGASARVTLLALCDDQSLVGPLSVVVGYKGFARKTGVNLLVLGDAAERHVLLLCTLDVLFGGRDSDLLLSLAKGASELTLATRVHMLFCVG
jgi:hypothetical protein